MSVEQLTLLIDQMPEQDALRAEEMLNAIASHNWDFAASLISDWALADEPDWTDIPDPFDGGIQLNELRAAFE